MRIRGRQRRAAACTREQAVAGSRRAARGRAALASSGVHDEHRSRHPLLVMHRQGFGPRSRHQNLRCTTCNILHNTIIKLIQITTTLGKSYSLIITKRTNNEGLFNHNIIETPPPWYEEDEVSVEALQRRPASGASADGQLQPTLLHRTSPAVLLVPYQYCLVTAPGSAVSSCLSPWCNGDSASPTPCE